MVGRKNVLFVCLGNICCSPIVEGVFRKLVEEAGQAEKWKIQSAATGPWHVGYTADSRALEILKKYNIWYDGRSRQIAQDDFIEYDYIFGMDEQNLKALNQISPENCKAKILLLGEFDPSGERIIRDPYFDVNSEGFEKCYHQAMRCCRRFLDQS